ncbi:MAG: hypothetical protein ACK56I_15505, partial [bacterium]
MISRSSTISPPNTPRRSSCSANASKPIAPPPCRRRLKMNPPTTRHRESGGSESFQPQPSVVQPSRLLPDCRNR